MAEHLDVAQEKRVRSPSFALRYRRKPYEVPAYQLTEERYRRYSDWPGWLRLQLVHIDTFTAGSLLRCCGSETEKHEAHIPVVGVSVEAHSPHYLRWPGRTTLAIEYGMWLFIDDDCRLKQLSPPEFERRFEEVR